MASVYISCVLVLSFVQLLIFAVVSDVNGDSSKFYSLTVKDIHGNSVPMEKYRGMILLIVNVASECGFTDKHYKGLVKMQDILASTGQFSILGFPCNQFGKQEPKQDHEIFKFAQEHYEVNFPMFAKVDAIDQSGVFRYLQEKSGHAPNWNFWKYLVDHSGKVLHAWGPWSDTAEIFEEVKTVVDNLVQAQGPPKNSKAFNNDSTHGGMESGSSSPGTNPEEPNLATEDEPAPPMMDGQPGIGLGEGTPPPTKAVKPPIPSKSTPQREGL